LAILSPSIFPVNHAEQLGLEVKLVYLGQSDGNQHRVHGKGLLRVGLHVPVVVELGDGGRLHPVRTGSTDDGVAGEDGHP
jgi:hypothetical protein